MAITYIKKAEKTAYTGEDETRNKVGSILKDLERLSLIHISEPTRPY